MIQLSTLPPTGAVPGVRVAGFPLGTTSDFALALAYLAGAPGGVALPAAPPGGGVVAALPGPVSRHAVAADGKELPTDAPMLVADAPSGAANQPMSVVAPPALLLRAVEDRPFVVAPSIPHDPISPDPVPVETQPIVPAPGVTAMPAPKAGAKEAPALPHVDMPVRARRLPVDEAAAVASSASPEAPQADGRAESDPPTPPHDSIDAQPGTLDLAFPISAVPLPPVQPAPVATAALPTASAAERIAVSTVAAPTAAAPCTSPIITAAPVSPTVTQRAILAAPVSPATVPITGAVAVSRAAEMPDEAGQPVAVTPAVSVFAPPVTPDSSIASNGSAGPTTAPRPPVAVPVATQAGPAPIETTHVVRSRPMPASTSPTTTAPASAPPRRTPVPQVDAGVVAWSPARPPASVAADLAPATADRITEAMAPVHSVAATAPAIAAQPPLSPAIDSAARPKSGPIEIAPTPVSAPNAPQAAKAPQPVEFAPSSAPIEPDRAVAPVAVTVVALPVAPPPAPQLQPAAQLFAAAMFAAAASVDPVTDDAGDTLPLTAASGFAAPVTSAPTIAITAPSQGQAPALDLTKDDWMASMIDRIETLRDESGSVRETRMRLAPEALGNVEVSVRRDEAGVLQVRIAADTPQARAMLTDAAPKLAEMAEARGVKLGGSSVDSGSGSAEHGRRDAPAAAPAQRRAPSTPAGDTKDTDDSRLA